MSYHLTCDRCGELIDTMAPRDSDRAADTITLIIDEGQHERFDLHRSCARQVRTEYTNFIRRTKANLMNIVSVS